MYLTLKILHMTCALISILGFVCRGVLSLQGSALLQRKLLKVAPHVVDTVLLLSAIGLLFTLQLNPLTQGWLIAKITGLIVYIGLGMFTLRFANTRAAKLVGLILAVLVFAYIAGVARAHSPLPFG